MKQPSAEEFLHACGAREPLVLEIERQGQRETVRQTLSLPFALVGRDERVDVRLDDPRVRNRHAYLQMAAGRLWCVELDSRTGAHAPQGQPAYLLRRGQDLRIGPFVVRVRDGGWQDEGAVPFTNPMAADSFDPSALPRVGLDFLEGTASQPLWMVDRVLTLVGRAAHCKVRLHSPTVSRTHCALLHTTAGLWGIDLLGRQGISVNGTAVRWGRLEDGDELRIGQFLVRLRVIDRPKHGLLAPISPATMTMVAALPTDPEGLLAALQAAPAAGGASEALLLPMIRQFSLMQQQMFDQFQQALLMMVQMFSGLHRDQLQLIRQELNQLSEVTRELQNLQAEQARQAPPQPASPQRQQGIDLPLPERRAEQNNAAPPQPSSTLSAQAAGRSDADVHLWLAQRLATLQQERQSRWQKILSVLTGK